MNLLDGLTDHPAVARVDALGITEDYFSFFEAVCDLACLIKKDPRLLNEVPEAVAEELVNINTAVSNLRLEFMKGDLT